MTQIAEPEYHLWTEQGYVRLTSFDVRLIVMYLAAYSGGLPDSLMFKLIKMWTSIGIVPGAAFDVSPTVMTKTLDVIGYACDDLAEHGHDGEYSDLMIVWTKLNVQIGKKPLDMAMSQWRPLKEKTRGKKKRTPKT